MSARRWLAAFVVAWVASSTALTAAADLPTNDRLLVLDHRAGPYLYLSAFSSTNRGAYERALGAFGSPSKFRVQGNLCRVTWDGAGVTIGFASELRPCATGHLYEAVWYGMTLFATGWHTRTGVRIGETLASVRRAYPHAAFARGQAGWLNLIVKRDQELTFTKLAVTIDRSGRVRTIEVPAAFVY